MTRVRSHCRGRTVQRRWMRRGGKLVNDPLTLVNLTTLVLFPPPVEKSPFLHFGAKHLGVCPFWVWKSHKQEICIFPFVIFSSEVQDEQISFHQAPESPFIHFISPVAVPAETNRWTPSESLMVSAALHHSVWKHLPAESLMCQARQVCWQYSHPDRSSYKARCGRTGDHILRQSGPRVATFFQQCERESWTTFRVHLLNWCPLKHQEEATTAMVYRRRFTESILYAEAL